MLRVAGVRHADMKGFSYSREDVSAKELANAYAQTLGQVFTHEMKPYEVELLVAEVGAPDDDHAEMYHVLYDGVVMDEQNYSVLGGQAEQISEALKEQYHAGHEPRRRAQARREGARHRRRAAHRRPARGRAARPVAPAPRVPPHQERRARPRCSRNASGQYQRSNERDRARDQHEQDQRRDPARPAPAASRIGGRSSSRISSASSTSVTSSTRLASSN